jgi:hypothetical protein
MVQVSSTEHPDCEQIRAAIAEAEAEIAALQEELSTAAPGEKPAIVRQIRRWQATMKQHRQRGTQLGCRL